MVSMMIGESGDWSMEGIPLPPGYHADLTLLCISSAIAVALLIVFWVVMSRAIRREVMPRNVYRVRWR